MKIEAGKKSSYASLTSQCGGLDPHGFSIGQEECLLFFLIVIKTGNFLESGVV